MILPAFIVLLGAFIRSVSGFGYALVVTPLLMLVIEPKSVVVINIIISITMNAMILFHMRGHVDLKRAALISLGSLPGILLGASLLSRLDPSVIKLAIAILVIPFSILLLLGHSRQFKRDALGNVIAGFMGGIFSASTSLGGPPVVLFLLNQGLTKERFVGTLAAYFLFTCIVSTCTFASLGMITTDLLIKAAILLPPLWLGTYLGIKVLPRINPTLFRRIASAIVFAAALAIIITILIEL
ncbi:sulfite exporter TauE/SafE family protein [Chloroflexota bacterium]